MKLYGKNPILERIRVCPKSIKKLYLQKKTDLSLIVREAKKVSLSFESLEKKEFEKICSGVHAQGVMAEVNEFEYVSFETVLDECLKEKTVPVFLDKVTDPQNLGAIIRTLACLGGFSLVLAEHESVHVNETVLRVANGGENYIKIAKVTNIATTIQKIKEKDVWVVGAVLEDATSMEEAELNYPLAAVMGSEGKGVRPGICKYLDAKLMLPMNGAQLSYNVAVATALFCYEISRKSGKR